MLSNNKHNTTIIAWYDEYSRMIYKYIVKRLKNSVQAEDLTQETFLKAYTYLKANQQVDYPKTFLYRIARHVTIDYTRKHKPLYMVEHFFNFQKDPGPSVEDLVESNEFSRVLLNSLDKLKVPYRDVIILRLIEELSVRETAHILDWTESKVKSTLFRGKKALAKQLSKEGVDYEI